MSEINRHRTRVIVVVHSHLSNAFGNTGIDLSDDVIEINTSKHVKSVGSFTINLVPRKNYLNLIFPNDVVNIYIDTNDGRGFVRTMMGYVDRINEIEQVVDNNTGATQTLFSINGSDFMKAIDRTQVYFNQHLNINNGLQSAVFGAPNLGGNALRSRGIIIQGTPADFIENLLLLLLGFGAQWVLPEVYGNNTFLQDNRRQRLERSKKRIPNAIKEQLSAVIGQDIDSLEPGADIKDLISKRAVATAIDLEAVRNQLIGELLGDSTPAQAFATILASAGSNSKPTVLDLMELSFIESMAIDGYIQSSSVWTGTGTLSSLLYQNSNEVVNELFFDLRPIGINDPAFDTQYSYDSDELGINSYGFGNRSSVSAIKYMPAAVFREYPYSVAQSATVPGGTLFGNQDIKIPLGPIFPLEPNVEGRKLYNYEVDGIRGITPVPCEFGNVGKPFKHLDVVTIKNSDVMMRDVGRSDADTFNYFAMYANGLDLNSYKYYLNSFMPILNPISITRHGLRVNEAQTQYAQYGANSLCSTDKQPTGGQDVDNALTRENLLRWSFLLDHWFQHNIEYLNGTVTLRGMPHIRVGYRLDWLGRNESYYIDQVDHAWRYPSEMRTTLHLSRGQRNDPFPVYVPPTISISPKTTNVETEQKVIEDLTESDKQDDENLTNSADTISIGPLSRPVDPLRLSTSTTAKFGAPRPAKGNTLNSSQLYAQVINEKIPQSEWETHKIRPHHGNDYSASKGQPVYAIADGTISFSGYQSATGNISATNAEAQNHRYEGNGGLMLFITHGNGVKARYFHLDTLVDAISGKHVGDKVTKGERIGFAGNSGSAIKASHLHFEIHKDGKPIDPAIVFTSLLEPTGAESKQIELVQKDREEVNNIEELPSQQVAGGDRTEKGRLAEFFPIRDSKATERAINNNSRILGQGENEVDKPEGLVGKGAIAFPYTPGSNSSTIEIGKQVSDITEKNKNLG